MNKDDNSTFPIESLTHPIANRKITIQEKRKLRQTRDPRKQGQGKDPRPYPLINLRQKVFLFSIFSLFIISPTCFLFPFFILLHSLNHLFHLLSCLSRSFSLSSNVCVLKEKKVCFDVVVGKLREE